MRPQFVCHQHSHSHSHFHKPTDVSRLDHCRYRYPKMVIPGSDPNSAVTGSGFNRTPLTELSAETKSQLACMLSRKRFCTPSRAMSAIGEALRRLRACATFSMIVLTSQWTCCSAIGSSTNLRRPRWVISKSFWALSIAGMCSMTYRKIWVGYTHSN